MLRTVIPLSEISNNASKGSRLKRFNLVSLYEIGISLFA